MSIVPRNQNGTNRDERERPRTKVNTVVTLLIKCAIPPSSASARDMYTWQYSTYHAGLVSDVGLAVAASLLKAMTQMTIIHDDN
nr:hypothetical protein CFP56_79278 [Quercus suber]